MKMSENQSWGKPTEIRVTTSHNFDNYLKCIELMYGKCVFFSNVEECLAILSVASELLVDDIIIKCMQYLEAVRWSADQESQIRNVLSRLGLKLLPDLAARLDKDDLEQIISLCLIIKQMVSLIHGSPPNRNRENAENYIAGIFEGDTTRNVVEVCGHVLLQEFRSSIGSCDFPSIKSLSKFIKYCDGDILKAAYMAFCEDLEFTKYVKEKINKYLTCYETCQIFLDTIIWFMKATGDGKIIISRASWISFLITWQPIMIELCDGGARKLDELEKAVLKVVESLPLVDKICICASWIELYKKYNMDVSTPLTFFKDLHDSHYKSASKQ